MTGGTVVILGETGQNFAAGMSGGVAFIYDKNSLFEKKCNLSMVTLEKVKSAEVQTDEPMHLNTPDELILKELIENHYKYTQSEIAKQILDNWNVSLDLFIKVMPIEYRRALNELNQKPNKETA
jgi:glutamate synthase (NADPH/NADH) large chain